MTADNPAAQQPKQKPDKRECIIGRLRAALDLMVFGDETGKPLDYVKAGRTMNISARSMRRSLERHAVRKYLAEQKQVARAAASAANIWHLADIAAQRTNQNAAVNAIRALDEGDPEALRPLNDQQRPGVVIRIINRVEAPAAVYPTITRPEPAPRTIDISPSNGAFPQRIPHDDRTRNDE
jgi:hypothetical protein